MVRGPSNWESLLILLLAVGFTIQPRPLTLLCERDIGVGGKPAGMGKRDEERQLGPNFGYDLIKN